MNILLAFFGWLAWNIGLFSYLKDQADDLDQDFGVKAYAKKHWDNWLLSLVMVPILIIIGMKGIGLDAIPIFDIDHLQWNDIYYAGSGFFSEALKFGITQVAKKAKKLSE